MLREITEQTGGRSFEIAHLNQLTDVASKIGEALRTEYVLGYSPVNPRHDGKYHRLQVKLASAKGSSKLHAYWRRGYYTPLEMRP
jgi:Ca-activated chloride channel family protein